MGNSGYGSVLPFGNISIPSCFRFSYYILVSATRRPGAKYFKLQDHFHSFQIVYLSHAANKITNLSDVGDV